MKTAVLVGLGLVCVIAAFGWLRSARYRLRFLRNIEHDPFDATGDSAYRLAQSAFRKEAHSALLYGVLALAAFGTAFTSGIPL